MAVTVGITETLANVVTAASKCAGGKPGSSENKGNCKNDYRLAQHEDLFEMLRASGSIQYSLSTGYPHASLRSTFAIYERALAIACPILLLFARHCASDRS
jgi:hypothetical protein